MTAALTPRAALRVLADAAGRVLADGSEASREVRLVLFERLAAAEETARVVLAEPVDDYAIRFAAAPPPTSAEWNALVEDHRRLRRELHDVTAAAAELKPARPVVESPESFEDAVRFVGMLCERLRFDYTWTTPAVAREIVTALIGDPVLTTHDDGTVTIAWPNDTAIAALVSREALDSFVASYSDLGKTVEAIRRQLEP